MIVAVNKMDEKTVNHSEKRYNEIRTGTNNFLKRTGFNPDKIPFVTVSGFNGDDMIERSRNMAWYKGLTLLEVLENVQEHVRSVEKPLHLPLHDIDKILWIEKSPLGVLRRVSKSRG